MAPYWYRHGNIVLWASARHNVKVNWMARQDCQARYRARRWMGGNIRRTSYSTLSRGERVTAITDFGSWPFPLTIKHLPKQLLLQCCRIHSICIDVEGIVNDPNPIKPPPPILGGGKVSEAILFYGGGKEDRLLCGTLARPTQAM